MVKRNSKLKAYKNKSLRSIERFASNKIENIFENLEALRKRSSFIHLRCRRHSNNEERRDTIGKTWKATSFKIRSPFGCLWNCIPRNSILESVRHTTQPSTCYRTGITEFFWRKRKWHLTDRRTTKLFATSTFTSNYYGKRKRIRSAVIISRIWLGNFVNRICSYLPFCKNNFKKMKYIILVVTYKQVHVTQHFKIKESKK